MFNWRLNKGGLPYLHLRKRPLHYAISHLSPTFTFSPSVQSLLIAAVAHKLHWKKINSTEKQKEQDPNQQWKGWARTKDRWRINDSVNSAVNTLLEHTRYWSFNQQGYMPCHPFCSDQKIIRRKWLGLVNNWVLPLFKKKKINKKKITAQSGELAAFPLHSKRSQCPWA